jgi:hypothetical protein
VPIVRKNNCVYATHGTCYSVWMTVWYAPTVFMWQLVLVILCGLCGWLSGMQSAWFKSMDFEGRSPSSGDPSKKRHQTHPKITIYALTWHRIPDFCLVVSRQLPDKLRKSTHNFSQSKSSHFHSSFLRPYLNYWMKDCVTAVLDKLTESIFRLKWKIIRSTHSQQWTITLW